MDRVVDGTAASPANPTTTRAARSAVCGVPSAAVAGAGRRGALVVVDEGALVCSSSSLGGCSEIVSRPQVASLAVGGLPPGDTEDTALGNARTAPCGDPPGISASLSGSAVVDGRLPAWDGRRSSGHLVPPGASAAPATVGARAWNGSGVRAAPFLAATAYPRPPLPRSSVAGPPRRPRTGGVTLGCHLGIPPTVLPPPTRAFALLVSSTRARPHPHQPIGLGDPRARPRPCRS